MNISSLDDRHEDLSADGLRAVADSIRFVTGENAPVQEEVAAIADDSSELIFEILDTDVCTPSSNVLAHRERFLAALDGANASPEEVARRALGRQFDPLKGPQFHPGR